jgi:hypothetical protein
MSFFIAAPFADFDPVLEVVAQLSPRQLEPAI